MRERGERAMRAALPVTIVFAALVAFAVAGSMNATGTITRDAHLVPFGQPIASGNSSKACSAATTCLSSTAINVAAGASIYVFVSLGGKAVVPTVSSVNDTSDNHDTFALVKGLTNGVAEREEVWSANSVTGSVTEHVQVNTSAAANVFEVVVYLTGMAPGASSLDVVATGATGTSASPADAVTTTINGDLVLMGVAANDSGSATTLAGQSGYTGIASGTAGATNIVTGGVLRVAQVTAGAITPAGTLGASSTWAAISLGVRPSVPPAPTGLAASSGPPPGSVTLSWTNPVGVVINDTVFYSTSSSTGFTGISVGVLTGYVVAGLAAGVYYFFEVAATNSSGESVVSSQASAYPAAAGGPGGGGGGGGTCANGATNYPTCTLPVVTPVAPPPPGPWPPTFAVPTGLTLSVDVGILVIGGAVALLFAGPYGRFVGTPAAAVVGVLLIFVVVW
jgi:hypothetical protein